MVTGFSMESQDMRMCKTESVFSGAMLDYSTHRVYDDEDCFGDILNLLDFPMESLEGDGFAEDWASKLGPIPSEVFKEVMTPPPSQISNAKNSGSHTDSPFQHPVQTTLVEDKKFYPSQAPFQAPSPNSVLESRASSLNNKAVPVRTRSKRVRPTANPWLSPFMALPNKGYNGKKPVFTLEAKRPPVGIKKCTHCEITKTPQWREGPMGPRTLCNACGVRYRSGRLYPEYRPAASPTFVPDMHSNSHRKVIEMRQKTVM